MTTPPKRKLRSNFPKGSYLWSVRNAQWHAMGIPEEDHEKPKIAVVNSSSELAACYSHLDQVAVAERPDGTRVHFMPFPTPLHDTEDQLVGAVNVLIDLGAVQPGASLALTPRLCASFG